MLVAVSTSGCREANTLYKKSITAKKFQSLTQRTIGEAPVVEKSSSLKIVQGEGGVHPKGLTLYIYLLTLSLPPVSGDPLSILTV